MKTSEISRSGRRLDGMQAKKKAKNQHGARMRTSVGTHATTTVSTAVWSDESIVVWIHGLPTEAKIRCRGTSLDLQHTVGTAPGSREKRSHIRIRLRFLVW